MKWKQKLHFYFNSSLVINFQNLAQCILLKESRIVSFFYFTHRTHWNGWMTRGRILSLQKTRCWKCYYYNMSCCWTWASDISLSNQLQWICIWKKNFICQVSFLTNASFKFPLTSEHCTMHQHRCHRCLCFNNPKVSVFDKLVMGLKTQLSYKQ